jgi:hypothetical protein
MRRGEIVRNNYNGANPEIVGEGGIKVKDQKELLSSIEAVNLIDRKNVFEYSHKFYIKYEIEGLLNAYN